MYSQMSASVQKLSGAEMAFLLSKALQPYRSQLLVLSDDSLAIVPTIGTLPVSFAYLLIGFFFISLQQPAPISNGAFSMNFHRSDILKREGCPLVRIP